MVDINSINIKDIVFVKYPFEEDPSIVKSRPALVIDKDIDNLKVLVVKVTKTLPRDRFDYRIVEWMKANLKFESTARASKIQAIKVEDIDKKIGTMTDSDYNEVIDRLNEFLDEQEE